jgi:hypothetical protein
MKPAGLFPFGLADSIALQRKWHMNTFERRRIVKAQVVDVAIAKTAVNKSRRQSAEAARKLRKAMAANHFASSVQSETVSYPRQALG